MIHITAKREHSGQESLSFYLFDSLYFFRYSSPNADPPKIQTAPKI